MPIATPLMETNYFYRVHLYTKCSLLTSNDGTNVVSEKIFLNKIKTFSISRIRVTNTGAHRSQKRCISNDGIDLNLNVNKCLITVIVLGH